MTATVSRRGSPGDSLPSGSAVSVYGGLFSPDFLRLVASFSAPYQGGEDYGLPKGLNLRDEMGRWWRIAQGEWEFFGGKKAEGPDASRWMMKAVLKEILSFDDLVPCDGWQIGERRFPVTHLSYDKSVPLVLLPSGRSLDQTGAEWGDGHRKRSPQGLLQEFLNARPTPNRWGLVFNGSVIRLVRENPSLTRPAYIEADLKRIMEEDLYPDFVLFCLLFHASRFRIPKGQEEPVLEIWRGEAEKTGERALADLRNGVRKALQFLGNGFLAFPTNDSLRKDFYSGEMTAPDFHQQLLRLVYRFLFLMTVEDRNLLHERHDGREIKERYRAGYSMSNLRERARRRRLFDDYPDLWQGLLVTFEGLANGSPELGLSPLGGLFSQSQCSHLTTSLIDNASLLSAVRELGYFESHGTLSRINYRDMDTEELGSVYEHLLELHPAVNVDGTPWRFFYVGYQEEEGGGERSASGSERKSSGTYYTPDSLVQELIRSALDPVIDRTLSESSSPAKALLNLRIVDPSCGSGHFLLAAARRLALELARVRMETDSPDEGSRRHALREVVAHTIFGVDVNPLAVELCRTALWLETVEPGKPLGFLDNHILCGNSLVGLIDLDLLKKGIPAEAYVALSGDDKEVARQIKKKNNPLASTVNPFIFKEPRKNVPETMIDLDTLPEETLEDIAQKKAAWVQQLSRHERDRLSADLFTSAFFLPKTREMDPLIPVIPVTNDLNMVLQGRPVASQMQETVEKCSRDLRFFHWPLMFPDVFDRGGFDVVLGNPPWERIKLQEEEYFKTRMPEIAEARNAASRKALIEGLETEGPDSFGGQLYRSFLIARRRSEAESQFVRTSGRYPLTGRGDVNTYALFSETILALLNPQGRAGFLVPTGIAVDDTTKVFFDFLVQNGRLVSLFDFENREGVFTAVHKSYRFSLVTLGNEVQKSQFVFFATRAPHLSDDRRRFSLTADEIRLFNPNTGTCPTFRSQKDFELTKKIYERAGVFIREEEENGNPWGVKFSRLFDMSNDSALFKTAPQLVEAGGTQDGPDWILPGGLHYVPLYEAKMVHQFDHRFATYDTEGKTTRDVTDLEKANSEFFARPRYWVPEKEVDKALSRFEDNGIGQDQKREWLLGWRKIARSTDERTVIAGMIPRVGVGDNMSLLLSQIPDGQLLACLFADLNGLVHDYVARQKVGGTNLNYFIINQIATLPPSAYSPEDLEFVRPRVLELVYTARDLAPFARDMGYDGPPFVWDPDRRALLRAELDAFYARKYGLTREELLYVLDPAEVCGEDYPSVTFPGLRNNEMREFGEYRTKRLILEAWDKLFGSHLKN